MIANDKLRTPRLAKEVDQILNAERQYVERELDRPDRAARLPAIGEGRHGIGVSPKNWVDRRQADYLYRHGQILVDDADLERVLDTLAEEGIKAELGDSLLVGVTLIVIDGEVTDVLRLLDERLGVGVATPNHVLSITPSASACPATEPDEPGREGPWPGLGGRDDGSGVRVTIVDTGFLHGWESRSDLPWLADITEYEVDDPDVLEPAGFIDPYAGHGTFIAGVVRCMAPAADLTVHGPIRVAGVIDEASLVVRLSEALDKSPDLVSLSAGCYTRKQLPLKAFTALWERRLRHQKGVVLIAAAGNDACREPFWPASFPWAVSVGALTADGRQRAAFSNFGGWVDVYAPGVDIVNAYCEGEYQYLLQPGVTRKFDGMCKWSGTSFSTPIVTGMIAARMSRTGESARQAGDVLLEAARGQFLPGVGPRLLP